MKTERVGADGKTFARSMPQLLIPPALQHRPNLSQLSLSLSLSLSPFLSVRLLPCWHFIKEDAP